MCQHNVYNIPPIPAIMERIDKILSNHGYCTRKFAKLFLKDHEVTAKGERLLDPSDKISSTDMLINGEPLDHPEGIFILLNKPKGYVCSHDIADGRLVFELLPDQWLDRNPVPSTIGRLDKDTTGVLLITDNTKLIHMLISPKREIDKEYIVTVDKILSDDLIKEFAAGTLMLEKEVKPCLPAMLTITDATHATVVLHEGKYHQVKRMFAHFGYTVTELHRSRFGEYTLGDLAEGEWIDLKMPEVT